MNRGGRPRNAGGHSGSRGRASSTSDHYDHHQSAVGENLSNSTLGGRTSVSRGRGQYAQRMDVGSSYGQRNDKARSSVKYVPKGQYRQEFLDEHKEEFTAPALVGGGDDFPLMAKSGSGIINFDGNTVKLPGRKVQGTEGGLALHTDLSHKANITHCSTTDKPPEPLASRATELVQEGKIFKTASGVGSSSKSELSEDDKPFDICPIKAKAPFTLKPSLLAKNREKRNEAKHTVEGGTGQILRPGMVLLKKYLSLEDQVNIIKACRDLGVGPGGFYQPGYRDGAKLRLKMMCLGKNWDPETSQYGDLRQHDDAKPPVIPDSFSRFVEMSIKESHTLIARKSREKKVEDVLPSMRPDICIVNFYSETGRLGLHQDKDETARSLYKRLPVVSISIGDTAKFLYGDQRETDKADEVLLESGDVLLFGGPSRHVFHGVSSILPNTAPKSLVEDLNLRKGRLNLTFREY